MEDSEIIALYFRRDEAAIAETAAKYGDFCRKIALNILPSDEDAKECVNDAYLQAWNSIPPNRPDHLGAWLGRVVRNLAYNGWKKNHRQKRGCGMDGMQEELADCIPSPVSVEREIETRELTRFLNRWLAALPKNDRILFLRRYWYGDPVNVLAQKAGISPVSMAKRMYRIRQNLKSALEKEGYLL